MCPLSALDAEERIERGEPYSDFKMWPPPLQLEKGTEK
jgi:hypothetical protein